jgi:hypothetical protein
MKYVLLTIVVISTSAFGQKQKDKDMQAKIDTLTKHNLALTDQNKKLKSSSDSLSKQTEKYYGLYAVIKDKVVKMDFDPATMSKIIDSLRAGRESAITLSGAAAVLLGDSVKKLHHINDSLRKEVDGLRYAVNLLKGHPAKSPVSATDFTGSWDLLLRKVKIIGKATHGGIVEAPAAGASANFMDTNTLVKVNFIDKESAELTFANQETAKCYYAVVDFSKTSPYYIDFKGTKADFRMYFTNTAVGTRISFQIPDTEATYYFGEMTR